MAGSGNQCGKVGELAGCFLETRSLPEGAKLELPRERSGASVRKGPAPARRLALLYLVRFPATHGPGAYPWYPWIRHRRFSRRFRPASWTEFQRLTHGMRVLGG